MEYERHGDKFDFIFRLPEKLCKAKFKLVLKPRIGQIYKEFIKNGQVISEQIDIGSYTVFLEIRKKLWPLCILDIENSPRFFQLNFAPKKERTLVNFKRNHQSVDFIIEKDKIVHLQFDNEYLDVELEGFPILEDVRFRRCCKLSCDILFSARQKEKECVIFERSKNRYRVVYPSPKLDQLYMATIYDDSQKTLLLCFMEK